MDILSLEREESIISTNESFILNRLKAVEKSAEDIIKVHTLSHTHSWGFFSLFCVAVTSLSLSLLQEAQDSFVVGKFDQTNV